MARWYHELRNIRDFYGHEGFIGLSVPIMSSRLEQAGACSNAIGFADAIENSARLRKRLAIFTQWLMIGSTQ
jgi:hypothetical protein